MSTVLTNGVIIPENGSRNWGGDLANNWNILDVNVGYMTDVKNRVTTLETSKQDNLSEQQIANIADVTNKANDADVVHKSGNETIVGPKTFSNVTYSNKELAYKDTKYDWTNTSLDTWCDAGHVSWSDKTGNRRMYEFVGTKGGVWRKACYINENQYFNVDSDRNITFWGTTTFNGNSIFTQDISYKNSNLDLTATPTSNTYANFIFRDKNNKTLSYLQYSKQTSGNDLVGIYLYDSSQALHGLQVTSNNYVVPLTNNAYSLGSSSAKWKDIYATNATINTSDRNAKQNIAVIDDKLLEAWDKVSLVSFKFKDAVEKKGDDARTHTGYIAQDIKEELNKYGIDARKYGLFCYNSWDAQEEKSHEEKRTNADGNIETVKVIDTPAREAGETYGLRYIECLVVECAYLRKKNKELEDRITKLEEKFN